MARSLHELLLSTYGIETIDEDSVVDVNTTVGRVLPNNPQRIGLLFLNLSANNIYIKTRGDVASNNGISLIGNGSGYAFTWEHDGILISRNWYAVASVNPSRLYIQEVRINPSIMHKKTGDQS